jgi:hypothetical protein
MLALYDKTFNPKPTKGCFQDKASYSNASSLGDTAMSSS